MEERNAVQAGNRGNGGSAIGLAAPFVVGLVVSLIIGWWLFPKVLYSQKTQPIRFSHTIHVEDQGMLCEDCHYFREDGSYNGLPTLADCEMCHVDVMGEDPAEKKFVEEYVYPGKQVDWLVYQRQPDNVFFSHAVHRTDSCNMCHDFGESELCSHCHPNVAETDTPPVLYENRLTEYSKSTMKMWQCEECHANENHYDGMTTANNACFTCHK